MSEWGDPRFDDGPSPRPEDQAFEEGYRRGQREALEGLREWVDDRTRLGGLTPPKTPSRIRIEIDRRIKALEPTDPPA